MGRLVRRGRMGASVPSKHLSYIIMVPPLFLGVGAPIRDGCLIEQASDGLVRRRPLPHGHTASRTQATRAGRSAARVPQPAGTDKPSCGSGLAARAVFIIPDRRGDRASERARGSITAAWLKGPCGKPPTTAKAPGSLANEAIQANEPRKKTAGKRERAGDCRTQVLRGTGSPSRPEFPTSPPARLPMEALWKQASRLKDQVARQVSRALIRLSQIAIPPSTRNRKGGQELPWALNL